MDETEPLTPKQESFCAAYTTIGAETFSHGTKSAIAAGYSEKSAYSQASALLKNPKIRQRVSELHAENMSRNGITVEKVLADLEHDKLMARQAGQYGVARECSIAQGKYLAMFSDRVTVDPVQVLEISERQRVECDRIARILALGLDPGPPWGEPTAIEHRPTPEAGGNAIDEAPEPPWKR